MLNKIHIKNYAGIKDLEIKDFKRINLFVGDNGVGKTTVLNCINNNHDPVCMICNKSNNEDYFTASWRVLLSGDKKQQLLRIMKFVEIMKEFEPRLVGFEKNSSDEIDIVMNDQSRVHIREMGSGFLWFLRFLLTIDFMGDAPAILCIDEIDNGLHYSKQEYFWKTMFGFLKQRKNLQIFATTHSYDMIKALSEVFEESGKADLGEDEIRLFTMLKDERGIVVGDYGAELIAAKVQSGIEVR